MPGSFFAILLLLLLSAFFSGTETAYASANELRLRNAAEHGGFAKRIAYEVYGRYNQALTTVLLGNNLVNIASSSIATVIVIGLLGDGYAWVATVVMTVLLLTFGEILPKVLAKQYAEEIATGVAVPVRGLMWLAKPIVSAVGFLMGKLSRLWKGSVTGGPSVTEDDLEVILDTVEDEGIIDEETTELLQSALEFDDVLAFEIITPRVDMVAIDINDPYDEIVEAALSAPYSRIPVYDESKDNIIGILHLNRLLKRLVDDKVADIRKLLMPATFIHKTMPLPDVLATMKARQCHMVIVSDEYGGTMGILTMEDVLEQLVGDIWDESDEIVDEFEEIMPGRYEADGDMRIHDFFEELDIDDRDFDNDNATLGGWSIEMMGGFPKVGDSFAYKNVIITVERIHKRRVTRLLVDVLQAEAEDEGE